VCCARACAAQTEGLEIDGDKGEFIVQFGCVKKLSFGESISSKPVPIGGNKWKVVYFPKGFTDPDYASVYVCNVDCDMDEGDADDADKITSKAFATVQVGDRRALGSTCAQSVTELADADKARVRQLHMQPKPPDTGPAKKSHAADDDDDDGEDDDDDDDVSSAASAATPKSTQGGSKRSGSRKSGSQRSQSSRKSQDEGGEGGGGGGG